VKFKSLKIEDILGRAASMPELHFLQKRDCREVALHVGATT
jgi:hypothetical protein